jgi:hypothetical protein
LQLWVHLGFGPVGSTDQKVNPHPTRMNQQWSNAPDSSSQSNGWEKRNENK